MEPRLTKIDKNTINAEVVHRMWYTYNKALLHVHAPVYTIMYVVKSWSQLWVWCCLLAVLLDDDPTVLEGQQLILNCTLTQAPAGVTSRDLFLQFGNKRIPEVYLSRPDDLTLILNMTASMNMSNGHMFCYATNDTNKNGIPRTLSHQVVTVLREYRCFL